jgi:hypothetical protein
MLKRNKVNNLEKLIYLDKDTKYIIVHHGKDETPTAIIFTKEGYHTFS